jgi:hypothetical protein
MPQMPNPNGHGAAVDLGQLKAQARQREALEARRGEMEANLLQQVGLQCACGQRIRSVPTLYFTIAEAMIPTPQGPQAGLNFQVHTCCSRDCPQAIALDQVAIARRDGSAGRVTWLDEKRARASAQQ